MNGKKASQAAQLVEDIVFKPTHEQVQVKAAFWAKYSANPLVDTSDIKLSHVEKFVNDPRIKRWWSLYQFKEWFLNEEEFAQRVLALAHIALADQLIEQVVERAVDELLLGDLRHLLADGHAVGVLPEPQDGRQYDLFGDRESLHAVPSCGISVNHGHMYIRNLRTNGCPGWAQGLKK